MASVNRAFDDPGANDPSTEPVAAPQKQGGYDYGKFMDAWWHAPNGTNLQDFINKNQDFTQGASVSHGGEYLDLPGGESMDAYRDFGPGGENHPTWGSSGYDYGSGRKLSAQESADAESKWAQANGGGGGGDAAQAAAPAAAPAAGSPYGRYSDQIYKMITDMMSKGSQPVTEQDVASQFGPISQQIDQGAKASRAAAAERLAAGGLNNGGQGGALDAEVNKINEGAGTDKANAMGGFITQEMAARRQQIVQAIDAAQGEDKTALQLQLAQMDQQIRQQQLVLQDKGLGLQSTQIGNQNAQFYDRLGFDYGQANNNSNDLLLSALLG